MSQHPLVVAAAGSRSAGSSRVQDGHWWCSLSATRRPAPARGPAADRGSRSVRWAAANAWGSHISERSPAFTSWMGPPASLQVTDVWPQISPKVRRPEDAEDVPSFMSSYTSKLHNFPLLILSSKLFFCLINGQTIDNRFSALVNFQITNEIWGAATSTKSSGTTV